MLSSQLYAIQHSIPHKISNTCLTYQYFHLKHSNETSNYFL